MGDWGGGGYWTGCLQEGKMQLAWRNGQQPAQFTLARFASAMLPPQKAKDYASQIQLRAFRKGPLTSKLASASPRRFTGPA
eukprot:345732-Pelagomonas_calceolata.AAC.1